MNKLLKTYIPLAALLLVGGAVTAQVKVDGNVYGGGNKANVKGSVTVIINQGGAKVVYDVYGGGALADVNVTTENNVSSHTPNTTTSVTITKGTVGRDVYGGGLGQKNGVNGATSDIAALVYGPVEVNIEGGTVTGSVFGCNNVNGAPQSTVAVTVNGGTVTQSVYGGGNLAAYSGSPVVTINGGTVAQSVYGGGNLANVSGSTTVTVNDGTVTLDVYGGGALADVGTNTTVNIMGGTISRDIYGGGLGRKEAEAVTDPDTGEVTTPAVDAVAATVSGTATVNIGAGTPDATNPFTEEVTGLSGSATIGGNVYGCNNAYGSPQGEVTVNVFQTAHTEPDEASYTGEDAGYAIANVFGGGNEADFSVSDKTAYVNIYTCENTIGRVFGGGNAAAAPHVATEIQGGRIGQVFGGGNGERGPQYGANIDDGIDLTLHGGNVGEFYGGSNQNGVLQGNINVNVVNDGPCTDMEIDEFFCGGNFVDISGNLITTISCSEGMIVNSLYGGCNMANISGDVVLNVYGGIYTNVYGGSKGVAGTPANITGNVTLNLYGGTIGNVFGGSNINGNIDGIITVNVIDNESSCPLYITNIYGGSNETDYTPTYTPNGSERITPIVNVVHAKYGISGNVYGGSKGVEGATGDDETKVNSSPLVNIGYNSDMNAYLPSTGPNAYAVPASPRAIVAGDVYGGGDAATVVGNTKIMLRNRAKVFGNVYGGGNMGKVTGDTKVIVNGDNE